MSKAGGKREGAGRPRIDQQLLKIPIGYKLPRWLVEWIRANDKPASILIEDALKKAHKLEAPKEEL